jgi:hypothetical protein
MKAKNVENLRIVRMGLQLPRFPIRALRVEAAAAYSDEQAGFAIRSRARGAERSFA